MARFSIDFRGDIPDRVASNVNLPPARDRMASRQIAFKILVAGSPTLLLIVALGVWLTLGSENELADRDRDPRAVSDLVTEPSGTPFSATAAGSLRTRNARLTIGLRSEGDLSPITSARISIRASN